MPAHKIVDRGEDLAKRGGIGAAVICLSAALFYLYEYLVRVAPSVMKSELQEAFAVSTGELSNAIATYYYIYAPMQLVVGILFDKFGARRLLLPACFIVALGCLLMVSGVEKIWVLSFARFLMGLGSAFAFVGVIYLATIWYPPQRVAFISGLTTALGMMGAIGGESGLSRFMDLYGWQGSMVVSGVVGLVFCVVLYFTIPETPDWEQERMRKHKKQQGNQLSYLQGLKEIMSNPQSWYIGIVGATLFLAVTMFAEFWGVTYLSEVYGVSKTKASDAVTLLFFGFLIGGPVMGWLSDELMNRRLILTTGSFALGTVFLIFVIFYQMPFVMVQALMFLSGFICGSEVVCFVAGMEVNPRYVKGTSIAFVNMVISLFGAVFQQVIAYVLQWKTQVRVANDVSAALTTTAEDYRFALMVLPIMILAGGVVSLFIKPIHYKRLGKEAIDH